MDYRLRVFAMSLAVLTLSLALSGTAHAAALERFHIFAQQGFVSPYHAKLLNSVIDPLGGGDTTFSIPLRKVSVPGNGIVYWGASGEFDRSHPTLGDRWQKFLDLAEEAKPGVTINSTSPSNDFSWYRQDEFPGSIRESFDLALADTTKKPDALELIPEEEP